MRTSPLQSPLDTDVESAAALDLADAVALAAAVTGSSMAFIVLTTGRFGTGVVAQHGGANHIIGGLAAAADLAAGVLDGNESPVLTLPQGGVGLRAGVRLAERCGQTIGASLSRRLVEAMQANIEVRSSYGVGSTFTVTLPRALAS